MEFLAEWFFSPNQFFHWINFFTESNFHWMEFFAEPFFSLNQFFHWINFFTEWFFFTESIFSLNRLFHWINFFLDLQNLRRNLSLTNFCSKIWGNLVPILHLQNLVIQNLDDQKISKNNWLDEKELKKKLIDNGGLQATNSSRTTSRILSRYLFWMWKQMSSWKFGYLYIQQCDTNLPDLLGLRSEFFKESFKVVER